ncbi:unnamed protein product [Symbiodinium necroappetens]|uniref:Uncharacterized protein n=1 Tax=Symbiodinium necroappetens TaxID=1628268 RepID=A0A812TX93_9DINO|nr:unnamed protein product [Symbiodinium necroappetens]
MQLRRQLLLASLVIAETCERRCPLGQHWVPGHSHCRYDRDHETYCSCGEVVSADGSACLQCLQGPFDAHHASQRCGASGTAPWPLPGPVTLACDAFSLQFLSDESGEDHLLVTSASGITNLLGGGNESEGGYFVRFYFLPSGAGDAGEANREVAKNVTFSQGTGMITITSSNDEYAVTLNATPHGEYIKIEVEASRGFVPNPWEPGQTDFELELVVDVGLDGVEASWADAGQAAMPAWLGPTGAVGLLPLDFLVDCKATRTALHARWTGGLLGAGGQFHCTQRLFAILTCSRMGPVFDNSCDHEQRSLFTRLPWGRGFGCRWERGALLPCAGRCARCDNRAI